jgi:hypothetical protein
MAQRRKKVSIEKLNFAEPFFSVKYITHEDEFSVAEKTIILNLSEKPVMINNRPLDFFTSTIITNTAVKNLERCLLIEKFLDYPDTDKLFDEVKRVWTLAYDATHEERHKGVALWRSPKVQLGDIAVNMCFAGTVPLKVGLHREHWGGPPIKEVHVQIVGIGGMQQYYEKDLSTLYREDLMAPGASHIPMYDENIGYPWHQYETIVRSIFMAIEKKTQ